MKFLCCIFLSWRLAIAIENKETNTNNIGQFVGQLTSLLNQGALQQVGGGGSAIGYQSGGFPGRPYPPYPGGRPLPPPPGPGPYPPQQGLPGAYPPGPYPPGPFPPGLPFQQYPGGYPGQGVPSPTSLLGALSSIARYDDLRCVPRLLCEVASGARPGSYPGYPSYSQESPVPFLSKDALVTLLTVLNFVDDSPLLVFGRAALLGYTARGDSRACLVAYPTCPRDPDDLVNYLNNHNGGFFRFFNQQLPQYAPQYPHYPPPHPQGLPYPPQGPPYPPQGPPYPPQGPPYPPQGPPYPPQGPPHPPHGPPFPPQGPLYSPSRPHSPPYPQRPYPGYPQQYSAQNQRYQGRIQNQPEAALEYNYYTSSSTQSPLVDNTNSLYSDYLNLYSQDIYKIRDSKPKLVFPPRDDSPTSSSSLSSNTVRQQGLRGGRKLYFPSESSTSEEQFSSSNRLPFEKPVSMVFPDRTGTGDLRLDLDERGEFKVYFASLQQHGDRDHRDLRQAQVTFPGTQTMHFPQQ